MDREKKITPITDEDVQKVINNSVMGEGNRLVGNATEQKKVLVRPIANTDGTPNVMGLLQRVADEAEKAIEEVAEKSADISTEGLQPSIDEALETASKTIVGAINELRRQLAKATVLELTEVVTELPKVGEPNKFYLISKESTDANDLYDEWIWVNKGTKDNPNYKWEYAGAKKIEFNADEYLKKTNLGFGFKIEDDILKLESYVGALASRIDFPVLGTTMDGAWKECAVNRRYEWTDEEKASACETIGATPIPNAGEENGAFCVLMPNGVIRKAKLSYSNYPTINAVPVYNPNKTIMVNNAVADTDAVNKRYAEDNFVAKFTNPDNNANKRYVLYCAYTNSGTMVDDTIQYSSTPKDFAILQYNSGGNVKVAEPRSNNDATTKKYVDDNKGTKLYLHEFDDVLNGNTLSIINNYPYEIEPHNIETAFRDNATIAAKINDRPCLDVFATGEDIKCYYLNEGLGITSVYLMISDDLHDNVIDL